MFFNWAASSWKRLLKGYYDSPERRENFVVMGSGKFDFFRKSGDSLQGRYFVNQLWPLSYDEVCGISCKPFPPRDFANIQRIDQLELMARILPERLCSPLSLKGLSKDTDVSPVAIKSWLRLLEQLYFGFLVSPYHRKIHRAVKREKSGIFTSGLMRKKKVQDLKIILQCNWGLFAQRGVSKGLAGGNFTICEIKIGARLILF